MPSQYSSLIEILIVSQENYINEVAGIKSSLALAHSNRDRYEKEAAECRSRLLEEENQNREVCIYLTTCI